MPDTAGPALHAVLLFLLELGLLGAAGFWALTVFSSPWAAVVAVIVVAAAWGLLLSPKAPVRPPWPWHAVAAHVLFVVGAVVLFAVGQPLLATVYLALILVSVALTVVYRDRVGRAEEQVHTSTAPSGRRAARR
ncbi:YrdB family protein [Cellulosimicrobium funkei]|nr:YrdB family protein [Cellulosimicrobium funkei]